jgi:hypothetical protein
MDKITREDLTRGRRLKIGAVAAPLVLTAVPVAVTFLLMLLAASGPPAAAIIFFVGVVATILGFLMGLLITGVLVQRRSRWSRDMRERIAATGIRAEDIGWFRGELRSNEKRALRAVEARDEMLGDAYRETLASRLTATRIVRLSKREMSVARQRQNKLKLLKSENAERFQTEIKADIDKFTSINEEARSMLAEAESRLQMIEAAASRGSTLVDSEIALKKLSARSAELPLALESARMADEIRGELDRETDDDPPPSI